MLFTFLLTVSILSVQARDIGKRESSIPCPSNSRGEYPNCVCESGEQFNAIHSICPAKSLESLAGSCPDDSTGTQKALIAHLYE